MKTEKQISLAAADFAERWQGKGDEKSESQSFWTDLLQNVFGVEDVTAFIRYEERVKVDNTNFIDGHIPSTRVLIEQKSITKDLREGIRQSDGSVLSPFLQAKKYVAGLPLSQHPRWIVTCNFREFLVYDMEQPNGEPAQIFLENLGKEYYRLMFLVDVKSEHLSKEEQVSFDAGKIVARIHEALMKQYADDSPEALRWLNILCVRIVFCLYAEDAGAFQHDQFHDYLSRYEAEDMRRALRDLFEVLNTPLDRRSRYLKDDLKAFPYTNGGLFEEEIEIPQFTEELRQVLLQNASLDFDWSEISPTIFGAVFESTLNPETRRSGGMHYTSIENIHKVIDPLFLNDLRQELEAILEEKVERQRQKKLLAYQDKLASLTFLDPACGSGNFLTETYLSLRRLENEAIRHYTHGQTQFAWEGLSPIKVSIQQFYGIEINDFAVAVATTALWISEAQMLRETEKIIHHDIDFLPLKPYHNIREGNALRMDWQIIGANIGTDVGADIGADASQRRDYADVGADASQRRDYAYSQPLEHADAGKRQLLFMERDKFISIKGKTLPHWHQDNKVQFVTFRLADSLPQKKLDELSAYKEEWLAEHPEPWDEQTLEAYNREVMKTVDRWLDQSYGECLLRHEDVRQIVIDALLLYHEKRYILHHFVIMPNHVHLLLSPIGDDEVTKSIGSVKQYTANAINRLMGRKGDVWQRNVFDRMVRNVQEYDRYVRYIQQNPVHLPPHQYSIWTDLETSVGTSVGADASQRRDYADVGADASQRREYAYSQPLEHADAGKRQLLFDYIIGNPPFVGARMMTSEQKQDVLDIFGPKWKNVGNLDYVCCWYKKAAKLMKDMPQARAALVSTNSICQGEQVANLWQPLMAEGLQINFAHRTFQWDSESNLKAHVHCVIVGFNYFDNKDRIIFDNDKAIKASHINAYLIAAPNVFVESRVRPLCDVPRIGIGNKPIDGGNYLFTKEEMEAFIKLEPKSEQYFKPWYGSEEFIHQRPRYCLWLGDCSPAELRQMPHCMKRIEAVRDVRLASTSEGTRKLAERPTRFHVENMPDSNYIIVPSVSSERRRYVPMGFMTPDVLASNLVLIIPDATFYHFGVLESNVHMAWMRVVCGRLKSDYRYSKDIVYNNFPWPTPTEEQRQKIAETAQAILDARAMYPDSSLADLYDELTMPSELRKAHQDNDRAVMRAYGFDVRTMTETACVAELFKMYQEMTK